MIALDLSEWRRVALIAQSGSGAQINARGRKRRFV